VNNTAVHTFDNGVRVYDRQLLELQRERYRIRNVHEMAEEEVFLSALEKVPRNGVFLNVGAAIGYYAILAKLKRRDMAVHGVEPLPEHLKSFRENIALNGLTESDFLIHEVAVSTDGGNEVLFEDNNYGSAVVSGNKKAQAKKALIKVRAVTLAQLCKQLGCEIDLLQMDIQGLEGDVLERYFLEDGGATISRIIVGTHGADIYQKCIKLLKGCGYAIEVDDPAPANQPDGIICAALKVAK
jgi:FkbM family methyltransferase